MNADIWQAVGFDGYFSEGKTKPLILSCERQGEAGDYEVRQFVVKAAGLPGVLEVNLFAEIFGNLLAREFDIMTPAPEIIVVTGDFIEVVKEFLPKGIDLRAGFGVGSLYMPPLIPLTSDFKVPPSLRDQAAQIYAFDLWVSNPDRKRTQSNCALQKGQFIAIDFEESFSFLETQTGVRPWMVSRAGLAPAHFFHRELKNAAVDWTAFVERLKLMDEARLRSLVKDFPLPWLAHQEQVFDHLLGAQERYNSLHLELERSLKI